MTFILDSINTQVEMRPKVIWRKFYMITGLCVVSYIAYSLYDTFNSTNCSDSESKEVINDLVGTWNISSIIKSFKQKLSAKMKCMTIFFLQKM